MKREEIEGGSSFDFGTKSIVRRARPCIQEDKDSLVVDEANESSSLETKALEQKICGPRGNPSRCRPWWPVPSPIHGHPLDALKQFSTHRCMRFVWYTSRLLPASRSHSRTVRS